jgi:hypothetical protein
MNSKLLDKSEIYIIKNKITEKIYIGQVKCYYKTGTTYIKAGCEYRLKHHIYMAKNKKKYNSATALIDSIIKYGAHNHDIKPIFICPNNKANYYEVKYIRQYNTQIPNGLNIMKGGKKCELEIETKKKLSESKKGCYTGNQNPMWGKCHSDIFKEKMRLQQQGKILSKNIKKNMSITHNKNLNEGKLPPRRKHINLPKYIYYIKSQNKEGYEIRNHPILKQKQFVKKTISLEENLKLAILYLKDENNQNNFKQKRKYKEYNVPQYVRQINSEKYEGFEVKNHPVKLNKKWTTMKLTMEEKLELVKKYLEESSETISLSVKDY